MFSYEKMYLEKVRAWIRCIWKRSEHGSN